MPAKAGRNIYDMKAGLERRKGDRESSKLQHPSSREAPSTKRQGAYSQFEAVTSADEGADVQSGAVTKVLGEALDEARILHGTPPQPGQSAA